MEMPRADNGWYELITEKARPGALYRFQIDGKQLVPDPASRSQPAGIHGPSQVVAADEFEWTDESWTGRAWTEAILYELHVGTFTPEGSFSAVESRLDYLAQLGVTAIELMPVSSFPGNRNWGYDGVLPYAPAAAYGHPEDLKHLVNAAHSRNMMVLLDVVYNHFGPEGNYLPLFAPQFFSDRHHTPWGQAINFDGPDSRTVRNYFIHNALYWLEEYHLDGLRLDAVHTVVDDSRPDFLNELATTIHTAFPDRRHIHLVLENGHNAAHYLQDREKAPDKFEAQWNDDIHHALHVQLTGESDGYYADYAENPMWHLGRCLAQGFSYQGERSEFLGVPRGEPSSRLPPACFVSFLQNHDQIGNRAFGERIDALAVPEAVKAAMVCLLLAPSPPMLFMGEEFGASTPFLFFCDFSPDLAQRVTAGRRAEFARFAAFSSPEAQARIPDPNDYDTFLLSKLDWTSLDEKEHQEWIRFYTELLHCRRDRIIPIVSKIKDGTASFRVLGHNGVSVTWPLTSSGTLELLANLSDAAIDIPQGFKGRVLYSFGMDPQERKLPAFSVVWLLEE